MDSHGGLEVTIRQTESKKTTQQLRETAPQGSYREVCYMRTGKTMAVVPILLLSTSSNGGPIKT